MDETASTTAEGETVGEAKWAAVRALGRRFPGLTGDEVAFEVLEDALDDRPARVRATVDAAAYEAAAPARAARVEDPAGRLREVLERVAAALDLRASVEIDEDEATLTGTLVGADLDPFIGRHGQTIDAVQHLASRIAYRSAAGRKRVVVDAAGYRERRAVALCRQADRAVADALDSGQPVPLAAMSALERRVVHEYLRDNADVETYSEGEEPRRHLVVAPAHPA